MLPKADINIYKVLKKGKTQVLGLGGLGTKPNLQMLQFFRAAFNPTLS